MLRVRFPSPAPVKSRGFRFFRREPLSFCLRYACASARQMCGSLSHPTLDGHSLNSAAAHLSLTPIFSVVAFARLNGTKAAATFLYAPRGRLFCAAAFLPPFPLFLKTAQVVPGVLSANSGRSPPKKIRVLPPPLFFARASEGESSRIFVE